MKEETRVNSTEKYFDDIIKIMSENEKFLRENTEETYKDVIKLINDAIDFIGISVESDKREKDYVQHSMIFFIHHILTPSSYAIHMNILMGNLPSCFMELRLMLESLVKSYFADLDYPEQRFFQEKLELLEDYMKNERISISKLMKKLGTKLELKNKFFDLWSELSQNWIHTKGVVGKIVNQIGEKSEAPPWSLAIPMNYGEEDLDEIRELGERVAQFREILKVTIENYRQECGFE